jgi:predicted DsbA family dithiol-disulfide isomerase
MARLRVDIWSDIACPWCYVGKRRFERALARFEHRASVDVVWRSFELDPGAPREREGGAAYAQRLAQKYGTSIEAAEARIAQLAQVAKGDGLTFRFDLIRPGNTFDAHRLIHLAQARGLQDAVKERFLRAYMTEGEAIGRRETLVRLASEAGLDAAEATDTLASDNYAQEVRADEQLARDFGITGVPCFVLDQRYAVSGAQPVEVLEAALSQAFAELSPAPIPLAEGAVCGPDGC